MNKSQIEDLGFFGGTPMFDPVRPIGQLHHPDVGVFMDRLRTVFDNRRLTNNGKLVNELEERLAAAHGANHCIAVGNACLGIVILLHLMADGKHGEVIMPAFTYPGLPHLAQWAGQMPRFVDIDPLTHTLSAAAVRDNIGTRITCILGVHNVNSPCDIDALQEISDHSGIPLVYDSVHGLGCTYRGQQLGTFGRAEVFSLHATKIVNGFEGGYITTNDAALAASLRAARNFGFQGPNADIVVLGMNAKLNEIHSALALCSLDELSDVIEGNRKRYEAYVQHCAGISGLTFVPYNNSEANNYEFAIMELGPDWPLSRDLTVELLRAEGGLANPYYSPPLHQSAHCPDNVDCPDLPITEQMSKCYIQMPVGNSVSLADVKEIADWLQFIEQNAKQIATQIEREKNDGKARL